MTKFLSLLSLLCLVGFVPAQDKKDDKAVAFDAKKLEGGWTIVSGMKNGTKSPEEATKAEVSVKGDVMKMKTPEGEFAFKLKIDAKKTPIEVDIEITDGPIGKGSVSKGILELKGDDMKLCYDSSTMGDRPTKFDGEKYHLFVFKRKKADK